VIPQEMGLMEGDGRPLVKESRGLCQGGLGRGKGCMSSDFSSFEGIGGLNGWFGQTVIFTRMGDRVTCQPWRAHARLRCTPSPGL
jgi:hypothetical protein